MVAATASSDLFRRFVPPRELSRSAPRGVRLTGAGLTMTVIAWLLAIAAVPIGALLYGEARRQADTAAAFQDHGVIVAATVDRLWRKTGDGKPAYAALRFDAGGTPVHGERRLQTEAWRKLSVGSTMTVQYLPENPHQWKVTGERQGGMPRWVSYLVSCIMIGVAVICSATVRWQRALLTDGRVAPAVVTSFRSHKNSHGTTHRVIRYEFPLLSGGIEKGKASVSKGAAVGDTICVIYDPDRPARSRPYPLSLVTPDSNF